MNQKTQGYRQGKFTPEHPEKYKGTYPVIFRSSWECKFMRWCDRNPHVLEWSSESFPIPYMSPVDGKIHRYFPDGTVVIKVNDKIVKFLIEIKPSIQLQPPKEHKRNKIKIIKEQVRYAVNYAKWNAAKKWCDHKGYTFVILTEKDLNIS